MVQLTYKVLWVLTKSKMAARMVMSPSAVCLAHVLKSSSDGTENLGACPSRMDAPSSIFQPESYDRISVVKGPQTVQYANTGSAATVIFEREHKPLTIQ